jgi:hypothetical protein
MSLVFNRFSLGMLLSAEQLQDFLHHDMYRDDESYRNLKQAMSRLRSLRWDEEDDEPRLVALEARAFRLLAECWRLP